ncbi:hypothetical protein WOLCODRAFT_154073 [Wolfiporia cocos MD-104 SS10]|uniref:Glutaminase A central domain-containing protein n=1 Tax=Wolfiporia cocos (strain MD-104) TaxID=742152 RepID=A0A2H3K6G2_WOLCO|nr:hypothetical protein WOLCODRAFT_154073 [Wolfiporia cocos MD-104 SS10]
MAAPWVQADADERNVPNMISLTVRGIIALYAMSEIASNSGDTTRSISCSATTFTHEWQALELAGNAAYLPFSYSSCTTSRMFAYNMYADTFQILGTGSPANRALEIDGRRRKTSTTGRLRDQGSSTPEEASQTDMHVDDVTA